MINFDAIKSFGLLVIVTAFIIMKDKHKVERFLGLIKSPMFIMNILIVSAFSIYMLNTDDNTKEGKRRKTATKAALLGLLIAFMAHLEMKIAPFWLIWFSSYYLNTE